ncbi:MAG: hypothetical protein SGI88_22240 [Candidatus Hydrogenedentes bacterium]|nr:hypothetical protein [Candidatus Hydrogenedentota bacterium]
MNNSVQTRLAMMVVMTTTAALAQMYAIPVDQVDSKKVFWGAVTGFEKAGEVDYDAILRSTPELRELKRDKIERGTGKYWILMSQASDRSTRAIADIGQGTDYDLIALQGYLATLTPAIPADDLTKVVLERLEGTQKALAKNKRGKAVGKDTNRTAKAESKNDPKSSKAKPTTEKK